MIPQALHSLLGLCQRAGKAASGDLAVEQSLKRGKANLLIVAADASERTQTKWFELADRCKVKCYRIGTREELGSALGKAHRASVSIASREFAKGIVGVLDKEGLTPVSGRGCASGTQAPGI